jgi:hypothetical protein
LAYAFSLGAAIDVRVGAPPVFELSAANRLQSDASAADYEIACLSHPGTA